MIQAVIRGSHFGRFEFVWNLLLRRKQIEIVQNFVSVVRSGGSKVKQV